MNPFEFRAGSSPLLVSIPHAGTYIPGPVKSIMTQSALQLADTDWHVPILYEFAGTAGASILTANYSRYYVDLNRSAVGEKLYPGQSETGVWPVTTFADENIYLASKQPDLEDIEERLELVWRPYHYTLRKELERIKSRFGYALLWDAHSIRSQVPRFFEGRLPDFNLGTANGASCPSNVAAELCEVISMQGKYSSVLNGRFKGGYITRSYGDPDNDIIAVQLELSQQTYMDEDSYTFDERRSEPVMQLIRSLIDVMLSYRPGS